MSETSDIALKSNQTGSDYIFQDNDIVLGESLYNSIYIALFGGNPKASTTGDEEKREIREDWWGNSVMYKDEDSLQLNSETERTLKETPLNSSGRLKVVSAVESDLEHLKPFFKFSVNVYIVSSNRVKIEVSISSEGDSETLYSLIWSNGIVEEVTNEIL